MTHLENDFEPSEATHKQKPHIPLGLRNTDKTFCSDVRLILYVCPLMNE